MSVSKYKKASTFYLIGNLFNKGMAFLTVPIFTRILSTADYGIVTTYNSWVTILSMVVGFAIYMAIRASFVDFPEETNDFMAVTTTFTLASGGILCLLVGLISTFIKYDFSITLIMLCILHGLASALIQNYSMYLMMQFKYKVRTALMIIPNMLSVIFSIGAIMLVLKSDFYLGRIVPTAFVFIGFGMWIVLVVYRKSCLLFNGKYLKYALAISTPLVLHGIALNVLSQSDRTMITMLADSSQTGIYSLVHNFGLIATVVTTSLDGVWVPWFTEKMKQREIVSINRMSLKYINLMTYAMVGIIMVAPEAVMLLATKAYWKGIVIIPAIVLSNFFIFSYTMYVNIEHYYKKTIYITLNTVFAAVLNIVLNFIFIPKFGYVAAAYTSLLSYIMAFILHARYSKHLEPELYPLKYFAVSGIHILLSVVMFYVFANFWWIRWFFAVCYLLLMAYHERDTLLSLFPEVEEKIRKWGHRNEK